MRAPRQKEGAIEVKKAVAVALSVLMLAGSAPAQGIEVDFSRGKWNADDFVAVKSWRWNYLGVFEQRDSAIVNKCPDLPGEEIFRKHADDVYAALLHKTRLSLGATVSSTMSFDHRMAPIIVFAEKLGAAADGTPEFREHWEVCLFDRGINLWHHRFVDGKQKYSLAASIRLPQEEWFKPNARHELSARVFRNSFGAKCIEVSCGGHAFSHEDETLPETFQAGIIGCEGRNFFYDFKVKP